MAQNLDHQLLDRDNFPWAQEHVPQEQWYQITKYFPGIELHKDMKYVDAATGEVVGRSEHRSVPAGRVFLYGFDVASFVGIKIAGLETGSAGPVRYPGEGDESAPSPGS